MMNLRLLFILTISSLLASCSLIEDHYPPCQEDGGDNKYVMLSFQLDASGSLTGSRTDDKHPEVGSEYADFEDGVDFSDLGIFVFAREFGEKAKPEKLVFKTTDVLNDTLLVIDNDGPGAYYVDMRLLHSALEDATGVVISPNGTKNIGIRVLIVANTAASKEDWDAVDGTTFPKVIEQLQGWSVPMSYVYNGEKGKEEGGAVMDYYQHNIPMFGTQTFMATQEDLYYSRVDRKVYLGEVDLLRSLAKVRVIDNIHGKDAAGYPKIVDVEFQGSQSASRPLPLNAEGYTNGTQVHEANPADATAALQIIDGGKFRLGTIDEKWVSPNPFDDKNFIKNVANPVYRIGFVPEQKVSENGAVNTSCPTIKIKIAFDQNEDGTEVTETYSLLWNKYFATNKDEGKNVLRNHIYTFVVDLNNYNISATVDLVPYIGVNLNPVFGKDNPK